MSKQPNQHPQRAALHNEIHARPPERMLLPLSISRIVMYCDASQRASSRAHLCKLLTDLHLPQPAQHATHFRIDSGPYRLRWELHTEFVSWTFNCIIPKDIGEDVSGLTASDAVPQDWLANVPGQCLTHLNMWVLPGQTSDNSLLIKKFCNEETLVANTVAGGSANVYTDFQIHPDGCSRIVLFVQDMAPRRLGRLVQQLMEIETYRMAGLLGLPVARATYDVLSLAETELAELAQAIRSADRDSEPILLDQLTKLAGQVESQHATTHARFSATSAYFDLVDKRIQDIGEGRLEGLQTIREFMDRRLTPARSTCEWAARRQNALSERISRVSNLLRTRVEIEQQQSSQALLVTMNARQGIQLKLQSTVEGLSVVAITYYIIGLINHLTRGVIPLGWPWSPDTTAAAAIPVVMLLVWWFLRRLHHRVFKI